MSEALSRKIKQLPKHARTQRALFAYMFFHPESTLKEAAKALGVSYLSARLAWSRIKRNYNIASLCPICFNESFDGKVCHVCGFEFEKEEAPDPSLKFPEEHETVYALKNGGLKLASNASVIQNLLDHSFKGHKNERKFERLKEKLERELMKYNTEPAVEPIALRILRSEYSKFKFDYPELLSKHGTDDLIVRNVIKRLRPWLAPLSSPRDSVSEFQSSDL